MWCPRCLAMLGGALALLSACAGAPVSDGSQAPRQGFRTWKDLRDEHVVLQRFDYSCGAAALATLLRYYFGDPVSETQLLRDVLGGLSRTEIDVRKHDGLSLLDLQHAAQRRGYQAAGLRLRFSALPKLRAPVLVYLETQDFRHFAILRGIKEDRVFLADPSRGNLRMSVAEFAEEWPGVVLVVARPGFALPSDSPLAVRGAPPIRNELQAVRQALRLGP